MVQHDCEALLRRDLKLLKGTNKRVEYFALRGELRAMGVAMREAKVHINHLEQWVRMLRKSDDKG